MELELFKDIFLKYLNEEDDKHLKVTATYYYDDTFYVVLGSDRTKEKGLIIDILYYSFEKNDVFKVIPASFHHLLNEFSLMKSLWETKSIFEEDYNEGAKVENLLHDFLRSNPHEQKEKAFFVKKAIEDFRSKRKRYYRLNEKLIESYENDLKDLDERIEAFDEEQKEQKSKEQIRLIERRRRNEENAKNKLIAKFPDGLYHRDFGHGAIKDVSFTDNGQKRYVDILFDDFPGLKPFNIDQALEVGILKMNPFEIKPAPTPYEAKEIQKEKTHLAESVRYCVEQSVKRYPSKRKETFNDYVGRDRNFNAQDYLDELETNTMQSYWIDASNDPYFMAINSSKYGKVYIGKSGTIGNDIYDWRDSEMSSLYFNRTSLIGNKEIGISLIRDIKRNSRVFENYADVYNTEAPFEERKQTYEVSGIDDQVIEKIISQKKQKRVHDIIETIQKEQFEIISDERKGNFIVEGIAGSGKTMVLFHKIAFDAFKDSFNPDELCVISSSQFLKNEGIDLCKYLKIKEIKNFTTKEFYKNVVHEVAKDSNSSFLFEVREKQLSGRFNKYVYDLNVLSNVERYALKIAVDSHKYTVFTGSQSNYFEEMFPKLFSVQKIHFKDTDDLNELINVVSERRFKNIAKKNAKVANAVTRFIKIKNSLSLIPIANLITINKSRESNYSDDRKIQYQFLIDYFSNFLTGTPDYVKRDGRYEIQINSVSGLNKFNELTSALDNAIKNSLVNPDVSGPSFLVDLYDYIYLATRLASYRQQLLTREPSYLIYVADWCIKQEPRLADDMTIENYYFLMMYLINKVLDNKYNNYRTVYIDEYQNYSMIELKTIMSMCPNSYFNFFGDIMQKIDEKGLKTLDDLGLTDVYKYNLTINYRNSYDVCVYLMENFNLELTPVGIDGRVQEVELDYLKTYVCNVDDRICLITKGTEKYKQLITNCNIINENSESIERGKINIIDVEQVKGLEFDVVFLDNFDMTENEHYLAASRSIRDLYIISHDED